MVPDCLVYFDVQSLSFAKINPCQHSQQLVQAKIFWHKCSDDVKKLVCNKMPLFCWANCNVKNNLLFFNSELKTSRKEVDTGSNPFQ